MSAISTSTASRVSLAFSKYLDDTYAVLLTFIIALGFLLRFVGLANLPAGFFADEASVGYNAYTILTRGVDEYGVPHPVFFRAFGEYKGPIAIYSTVPFVALFGLNEFAVRLPAALYGTASILMIYLVTRELFKHHENARLLGILAALFLAISPWHVHISRTSLEGLTALVFYCLTAVYVFLRAQEHPRLLPVSMVFFALATYSYFPARIFVPLLGLSIFVIYFRFFLRYKNDTLWAGVVLIFLLVPLLLAMLSPEGWARWQQVSIFAQPPKHQTVTSHILQNYLSHFSLDFLFLKGDIDMPGQRVTRHSVRGMGELYFFQLPLFLLGLVYPRSGDEKPYALLIAWLLLFPAGSMFTTDQSAQATRSIIGVVPFQIFSALGLSRVLSFLMTETKVIRNVTVTVAGLATLLSFVGFVNLYYQKYPTYSADFWGWQYGPRQMVRYFVEHRDAYDEMFMAPEFNAPDIFLKFYAPETCGKCRVGLPHDNLRPNLRQLFAVSPGYLANLQGIRFRTLETVYYPNGSPAFHIGEVQRP